MAEFPMISLCTLYASILWTAVDLKWPECSKQLAKSGMPEKYNLSSEDQFGSPGKKIIAHFVQKQV
jgi:hypothetical protein